MALPPIPKKKKNVLPRVPKKSLAQAKFDTFPCSPWQLDKKDIKFLNVLPCSFVDGQPVCPKCGKYNFRRLDYGCTPPTKKHLGDLFFIGVCMEPDCHTAYKFYSEALKV